MQNESEGDPFHFTSGEFSSMWTTASNVHPGVREFLD
jgi:hypothetical protein